MQRNSHDLRPVVDSNRNDTVAEASADDHRHVVFVICSGVIFRKEPLIWSYDTTDERQPKLSAMCMPAEHQIEAGGCIVIKSFRTMRKQNGIILCPIDIFKQFTYNDAALNRA